jgi:polyhydroxyalkanoate synthesis repressor PhaR
MADTRVIKRYANRKLYDTQRSRYVTLDQIADMIRTGDDVKIVDNNTKEDLTSVTLAQIIFEEEKKQKSFLPLAALREVIQSGGQSLQEIASHAGARVRSVFRRDGADGEEEAVPADPEPALEEGDGAATGPGHAIKEFLGRSQLTLDEWQRRVDERIHKVVETLAPWTVLQKELAELEQRLRDLESRLTDGES